MSFLFITIELPTWVLSNNLLIPKYGLGRNIANKNMKWRTLEFNGLIVKYCGAVSAAETMKFTLKNNAVGPEIIAVELSKIQSHYAVIAQTENAIYAAVDHVRSTPIFWKNSKHSHPPVVGHDARKLETKNSKRSYDEEALREVAMAGYVTGSNTLVSSISQLEAGEVRFWCRNTSEIKSAFSYRHWPTEIIENCTKAQHERLGQVIDSAIVRTMNFAGSRPIIVPLSGGLDSRFVLTKLVEHGYGPLQAISYGPKNNPDAEIARLVSKRLRIPWTYLKTPINNYRALLGSELLNRYWEYSDGLSTVPNHQDLIPLITMAKAGDLPENSIIVNGQTGDFLTGGHIPAALACRPTINSDLLIQEIIGKHYGLWKNLMVPENLSYAHDRIRSHLALPEPSTDLSSRTAVALFELWEHKERQAKYVVNGQRIYEFLGLEWGLPLWDREFVEFWRDTTITDKFKQSLYKSWLLHWDYRGVFTEISNKVTAWPTTTSSIIAAMAISLRLVAGRTQRDRIFRYLNYYDRFGDHYKVFGFRTFAQYAQVLRNPTSLYVKAWLQSHGFDIASFAH